MLDDAQVDRAIVVGHSMGGGHGISLAAHHPDRVRGLVIVDNSPEPKPEGSSRARRMTHDRPERFDSRGAALAYLRKTSPGYRDEVYEGRLAFAFRDEGGALVWRSDPNALRRIFQGGGGGGWADLGLVRAPATVIQGTRSNVLSPEVARRMADLLGAPLVQVDAGHNPALEQPAAVAAAILELAARAP